MGTVIPFPGHRRLRCCGTTDRCAAGTCMVCELYQCERCGGAEASLPTDCPGGPMTSEMRDEIQAGRIDFVHPDGWRSLVIYCTIVSEFEYQMILDPTPDLPLDQD